jgi:ribosomal protein S18 acetylase RimI-like enzyme
MPRLRWDVCPVNVGLHQTVMQSNSHPSIDLIEAHEFDQFLVYLNDHLSDNGGSGGYFQPLSRSESSFPPERAVNFRAALVLPVGQAGWRRLWVARNSSNQIVGHIDLRSHAERFAEHRCLLGMGVDRGHRKIGLGKRLIEHAQEWTRANPLLEWIDLQVLSSNREAIRLYERSGFERVGEIPDMFRIDGHNLSYIAMSKALGKGRASDAPT